MDEKVMHLVWCADDNVQAPMLVSIGSALRCCKSCPVAIHIVTTGLSADFVEELRTISDRLGAASFDVSCVNAAEFANLQHTEWIPNTAYIRFLIDSLFTNLDRILYFDCDVLIRKDLAPLWKMELDGFACAGSDKEWAHDPRYCEQIGLTTSDVYVNSGVLLMNLQLFREQGLSKKLMSFARSATIKLPSLDQDVLNLVLRGKIKTVPFSWNYTSYEYRIHRKAATEAAVLHFTGSAKPWSTKGRRCRDWRGWLWRKSLLECKQLTSCGSFSLSNRLRLVAYSCLERMTRVFL